MTQLAETLRKQLSAFLFRRLYTVLNGGDMNDHGKGQDES